MVILPQHDTTQYGGKYDHFTQHDTAKMWVVILPMCYIDTGPDARGNLNFVIGDDDIYNFFKEGGAEAGAYTRPHLCST
jgi:hypothetical protein